MSESENARDLHIKAHVLYDQKRYKEAEKRFEQAVVGREKVFGQDHEDTLQSKHGLASSLYNQQKYSEAEEYFRQVVIGRGKVLSQDHEDTLQSKHGLAYSLHKQQKYSEAEEYFRQVVIGRGKVLGQDHEDTLWGKYRLASSLYNQQKYSEAEEYYRQAVAEREKVLGQDHEDTLFSKKGLAETLAKLERQHPPIQVHDDDELQNRSSGNTPANIRPQQEVLPLTETPLTVFNGTGMYVSAQHLDDFFLLDGSKRSAYTDSDILMISRLLTPVSLQWSKIPRTYIVLRIMNCLHLLDSFLASEFTDHWFPVVMKDLPSILQAHEKQNFLITQHLVLTRSLNLEKGAEGLHCYFEQTEALPLEKQRIIGRGGFGQVDEVLSTISYKRYARKRVLRKALLRGRNSEHLKLFIKEIETLKRLQHPHIVQFVGSYSDTKYLGLLMLPVAEMDLAVYLRRSDIKSRLGELRTFFGCLAAALDFLHTQSVRHKDIKPENILIDRGNVLFTDFGLSHDFADAGVSTTMSMVNGLTTRYCAPEVAMCDPRNKSSDIWSLGVVYLEMLTILKGMTLDDMNDHFSKHGTQQLFIRTNRGGFDRYLDALKTIGNRGDNQVTTWISDMLQEDAQKRPHTGLLVATISDTTNRDYESAKFCGLCCHSFDDDDDDCVSDFSE